MVTAADFEGRNAPVLDFGGKIGSKNFERGRNEEDERKTVGESIFGEDGASYFYSRRRGYHL